ncbi:MAG: phosphodiester glycosidase family protein [Acidobacteriota bacterium]|nr:phosphodiester glycosidase family protein [Acidobacteriota bacterium]MDE3146185.1 phosphodiester glycosidase family protein [Acidobacteriota bacterium]
MSNEAPPRPQPRPQPGPRTRAPYRAGPRHGHRLPRYVYWRRRAIVVAAIFTLVVFSYYGVTLGFALGNPSYGVSLQARFAEWGRQHGIGPIVTWAETEYNKLHPARVGGTPSTSALPKTSTVTPVSGTQPLPMPAPLVSPAAVPLAGEGKWSPAGRYTANGIPAVYTTFIRPDAIHTSYVVGVAWMDTKILSGQLYSGSQIPGGGPYTLTAPISATASKTIVAAFNAGFRMQDANGGYYTDNKLIIPLRPGAATAIIYKDGTMNVGEWGRDFSMAPDAAGSPVASVRQNLDLIVDGGKAVPGLGAANAIKWGKTLGGTFNVWRSGLGITSDGALVYAGGDGLSISDLANTLVRAGAVRAMQLDINTDWVQYTTYAGPIGTAINGAQGTNLLPGMIGNPGRFFANWWTRDFFVMSLKPKYQSVATAG